MTNLATSLINGGFALLDLVGGEFLNYMTANDLINNIYNFEPQVLAIGGLVGLTGLIVGSVHGVVSYESYKNLKEHK